MYGEDCYLDVETMAMYKADAKALAEKFTFPVRVCDTNGVIVAQGSCFSFYSYESGYLATSRFIAEAQRSEALGSAVVVKIMGDWVPCEVLCPDSIADTLGKLYRVAILKVIGESVAPAGEPQGSCQTPEGFIAAFSPGIDEFEEFHIAEGRFQLLSQFEFGVNVSFEDSWIGGPVLDTYGSVVGVITKEGNGSIVATMVEHLTYYSALLGLKNPAWGC